MKQNDEQCSEPTSVVNELELYWNLRIVMIYSMCGGKTVMPFVIIPKLITH